MKLNLTVTELPTPKGGEADRLVKEFVDSGLMVAGVDPDENDKPNRLRANLYEAAKKTAGLVTVYTVDGNVFLTRNADPAAVVAAAEAKPPRQRRKKTDKTDSGKDASE